MTTEPFAGVVAGASEVFARTRPDDIALAGTGSDITFAELEEHVGKSLLRFEEAGVQTGDLVTLELDRSVDAITCIFALWRIGAAFVPIDPSAPEAFRSELRGLGAAAHAIVPSGVGPEVADWHVIRLADTDASRLPPPRRPGDRPAYAIFTSGTSGRRRCVVVGHDQLDSLANGLRQAVYGDVGNGHLRVGMNGPLAFDTSIKQLVQLADGHTLVLVPHDRRAAPERMYEHLLQHSVDVIDVTPSIARRWLDNDVLVRDGRPVVDRLLVGGEAIDDDLWRRLASIEGLRVFNLYGPTECTVDAMCAAVVGESPRLGWPLSGVDVSLEDARGRPVPDFVVGDIVVRGAGVAWGYLDGEGGGFHSGPDGARYVTGDVARRHRDGSLEFLGRTDGQVKVSGVRLDLTEVELHLRAVPGVAEAAAAVRSGGTLVAVVAAEPGVVLDGADIRAAVAAVVPSAFVPAQVVVADDIPLTNRGKVDRNAVAEWAVDLGGPAAEGLEAAVATAMANLVGGPPLERDESFFRRGGDSLDALELSSQIADLVGHEVGVAEILLSPTPAGVAALAELRPIPATRSPRLEATSRSVVQTMERTLSDSIACGRLAPLDAVSVTCVPDLARSAIGTGEDLRRLLGELPTLAVIRETAHGRLGVILVPCFSSEAMRVGADLIEPAVRLGATLGARAASLTGDLAPASDYGAALASRIGGAMITTGQGSTVAAMANSWEAACLALGRPTGSEHVAVVGPGALTTAFVNYVATLRDGPVDVIHLEHAADARELGAVTSLIVAGLPRSAIDLNSFTPDTVVVEYGTGLSASAGRRGDGRPRVLGGGTLISPVAIGDLVHVPAVLSGLDEHLVTAALRADEWRVAACALAALLVAKGVAPGVIGVPDAASIGVYRAVQHRLGYRPDLEGEA